MSVREFELKSLRAQNWEGLVGGEPRESEA